jgi:hypothetical protein
MKTFFVIETYKSFGLFFRLFVKSMEFTVIRLTDTVSRSTDGLHIQRKENIAKCVLINYFYNYLILSEISLKSLVGKNTFLLQALDPINYSLLEHSKV